MDNPTLMEGKPHEIIARRRENQINASIKHGVNYTDTLTMAEIDEIAAKKQK